MSRWRQARVDVREDEPEVERGSPPEVRDWVVVRRDAESGIEALHAHFEGHAYDPHDHDEVSLGFTETGVQQFRCRRGVQRSTPGRGILIEPGEVHDGESPQSGGFTYGMLYVPQARLAEELEPLGARPLGFRRTLSDDPRLVAAIRRAFFAVFDREGRLARDLAIADLARRVGELRTEPAPAGSAPAAVRRACELMHAAFDQDLSLADLSAAAGLDRFALARAFKRELGLSPHAYLVQTRLKAARRALRSGDAPAVVAADTGFVDQSHLGRWFRRAYRLTPAAYARACTSVPD